MIDLGWHFSLLAGALALTIIMLPYVVRSTDLAFEAVPATLREGGYPLGATKTQVLASISAPSALTYVIWTFIGEPFESAHALAYGAAVLLMIAVFLINVVGRIAVERYAAHIRGGRSVV